MIQSVQIQNFKSVVDLTLELGTFNVLIGANGCGKSNILEAIAFGAAASADKLDHEFLGSRGIRITNPEFMFSAFGEMDEPKVIALNFTIDNKNYSLGISNESNHRKQWVNVMSESLSGLHLINSFFENRQRLNHLISRNKYHQGDENQKAIESEISKTDDSANKLKELISELSSRSESLLSSQAFPNYILYSPEQTSLRKFEDTNQMYPLGIKGEGLFQYLKELSQDEKNVEVLNEIKECLLLLDWYADFNLPKNLMSNEFALSIKDKYLNENLQFFDQRSTNEGFLYLLFYATLFTSKDTPQFFAIDNIDASFNPKLCMQVTKMLAELAKKHGKQVIVTTQNPAILDGLDLQDDSQRLFVVRRNEEGHTKAKRITYKAERTMKLSEVWTNGFIGGLPDNF